jgi:ABC-type dipeptide/oligopeptide/nickel transport system permease component
VVAATLLSGALFVLGNLAADLLLYAADPRIRQAP